MNDWTQTIDRLIDQLNDWSNYKSIERTNKWTRIIRMIVQMIVCTSFNHLINLTILVHLFDWSFDWSVNHLQLIVIVGGFLVHLIIILLKLLLFARRLIFNHWWSFQHQQTSPLPKMLLSPRWLCCHYWLQLSPPLSPLMLQPSPTTVAPSSRPQSHNKYGAPTCTQLVSDNNMSATLSRKKWPNMGKMPTCHPNMKRHVADMSSVATASPKVADTTWKAFATKLFKMAESNARKRVSQEKDMNLNEYIINKDKLDNHTQLFFHLPFHPSNPNYGAIQKIWRDNIATPFEKLELSELTNKAGSKIDITKLTICSRGPNLGNLLSCWKLKNRGSNTTR